MSPASAFPSAARPPNEQARSLVGFLLAHDHRLAEIEAQRICASLPQETKQAAKSLRAALVPLGIAIKHTHALKAVAVMRGSDSFLALGDLPQYDVASWSPDAPAVGSERVRLRTIAEAADELCRRLREQYENDAPLAAIRCRESYVGVQATSAATGSWWLMALVPVDAAGEETVFRNLSDVERLAERMRRL